MNKKSLLLAALFALLPVFTFAQIIISSTDTKKVKNDGIELTTYQDKPFTGIITQNYENGKLKSWVNYKNGMPDGHWQEWHQNGKLGYNAYWKAGKGHGLWQYFHDNGILRYEESFLMDIPNGISRSYYDNGQLEHDFFWLNGKKHGLWSYFSETGVLQKTEFYENDELILTTNK